MNRKVACLLVAILVGFILTLSETRGAQDTFVSNCGESTSQGAYFTHASEHILGADSKGFQDSSSQFFAPDEAVIKISNTAGEQVLTSLARTGKVSVVDEIETLNLKKVKLDGISVTDFIALAGTSPEVEYAEPNHTCELMCIIPNDPYYSSQWSHPKISSPQGWDITMGSSNTTIAVLDTGVDYTHPDLAGKVILGYDFYDDDDDPMDENGHGTYCAGIAAAITNNHVGVAGVSWKSKILAVRIFKDITIGYGWQIAEGITYAVDNGADVISLSGGTPFYDQTLKEAVDYAYENGCVIAAAVGNTGGYGVYYPVGHPHVIGVGATTSADVKADFSTYGPAVDVTAPGVSVLSTSLGGGYSYGSGTSAATPHVAGLAALIMSNNSTLTPDEVEARIEQAAEDLGPEGKDDYYGYGRINVATALGLMSSSQYITSLYQKVLEREPDSAGLAGWTNALSNGVPKHTIAYSFLSSTERCNNYVTGLYQNILGREPDSQSLAAWTSLTTYTPDEVVEAYFYGSDEYFLHQLPSCTNEAYVASLYQEILGRAPDCGGLAGWVNALNHGYPRTYVALAFLRSHEYHKIFVGNLYPQILGRPADAAGLNGWTNIMDNGMTERLVTSYLYGSFEYSLSGSPPDDDSGEDDDGAGLSREVAVWLVWWDQDNGFQCLQENKDKISSVKPFWYKIKDDASIQKFSGAESQEIINFAKNNNIKITPVICNEEDATSVETVIGDEDLTNQHIANILQLVEDNNYDGIEIDYESLNGYAVRPALSNFISQLADQLHANNKILGVSVHAKTSDTGTWSGPAAQDWEVLGQKADQVKIMTYDYHWSTSEAGDIAPLSWMETVLAYGTQEISSEKIYLGIHFYGYDWLGQQAQSLTYNDVLERIQTYNPEIKVSNELEKYFSYTKDGELHQVYFADHETITQRLQLVNQYDAAGIGIWRIGQEDPDNWEVVEGTFSQAGQ